MAKVETSIQASKFVRQDEVALDDHTWHSRERNMRGRKTMAGRAYYIALVVSLAACGAASDHGKPPSAPLGARISPEAAVEHLVEVGEASDDRPELNLDFEQVSPGATIPDGWLLGGPGYDVTADAESSHHGRRSVRLAYGDGSSFGVATQRVAAKEFRGRRIVVRGWLRRQGATRGSLGLWVRVDAENGDALRFKNMNRDGVRTDQDWVQAELSVDVPAEAEWIYFGGMLNGDGVGWVDNLELASADVPVAGPMWLQGRIEDSAGKAIVGATVAITTGGVVHAVTTTDATGSYAVELPAGTYSASATHPDYVAAFISKVPVDVPVTLRMAKDGGVLLEGRLRWAGPKGDIRLVEVARLSQDEGDLFVVPVLQDKFVANLPVSSRGYYVQSSAEGVAFDPMKVSGRGGTVVIPVLLMSPAEPDVLDAVRKTGIPLAGVAPKLPTDDLAVLTKEWKNVRVFALGEATHGTKEIFQIKHRLIAFLAKTHGVRIIAIESGIQPMVALDEYVRSGSGNAKAAVRAMGNVFNTEEFLAFVEWARTWNATAAADAQLRFVGVDMQNPASPIEMLTGYLRLVEFNGLPEAEATLELFRGAATYLESEPDRQRAQRGLASLEGALRKNRKAWIKKTGAAAHRSAQHSLRLIEQYHEMSLADAGLLSGTLRFEVRERAMAENAAWYLEQEEPTRGMVIWNHNSHVELEDAQGSKAMGGYLRDTYGKRLLVIGTIFGEGGFQAIDQANPIAMREFVFAAPSQWDVAQPFAAVGEPVLALDLRKLPLAAKRWFAEPHVVREVGFSFGGERAVSTTRKILRRFDVVIFIAKTSRARPIRSEGGPPIRR